MEQTRTHTRRNVFIGAGAIAAVGLGALLPSTFALWSDQSTVDGATITAGTLDIANIGSPVWKDVSNGTGDAATTIDLSTFRAVPGDTIQATYAEDIALKGDNMKAELTPDFGTASGDLVAGSSVTSHEGEEQTLSDNDPGTSIDGLTFTYTVTDAAGDTVYDSTTTTTPLELTPDDVASTLDGTSDYNVTVTATFDEDTPEQTRVNATAQLQKATFALTQVR